MTNIALTPEELAQIESQRKMQMELDIKREAAYEADFQKNVLRAGDEMIKYIEAQNAQVDVTKKCADALGLVATITWHNKEEKVYKTQLDGTRSVEWSEVYKYPSAVIIDGDHRIDVRKHVVYSKWSTRGKDAGFKMYLSGPNVDAKTSARGYVNTRKMAELLKDVKETTQSILDHTARQQSAVKSALAILQAQFPDATIRVSEAWSHNPYRKTNSYTKYDCAYIGLPNGISLEYRINADQTLTRTKIEFPTCDTYDFINTMSNLKF